MRTPLAIIAGLACVAHAQLITSTVTVIDASHEWGYRCGVKQPLGSVWYLENGKAITVHNISKEVGGGGEGFPDYLIWVDEDAGTAEVVPLTQDDTNPGTNPGGMASFAPDASVWFARGARANVQPFDLYHSGDMVLDDFVTYGASTCQLFHPLGGTGLHMYRYAGSSLWGQVGVHVQRYDLSGSAPSLSDEFELAEGSNDPEYGHIGIEQLWSRYDPRMGRTALTWQWWQIDERWFGSHPFTWTDDGGETWYDAAGTVLVGPLAYEDRTETLVPVDHVALGLDAQWHPRDLGWTPGGVPWMTVPEGLDEFAAECDALFTRWTGTAWETQTLAGPVIEGARPYACGATRDYMVFAYAESDEPGRLYARWSGDEGATWSSPTIVDDVGAETIGMVSFCQPVEFADNRARFIVGHYEGSSVHAKNYEHALRIVTVRIRPPLELP